MAIRRTDEDLFEESRMTFGEHLEELRKVLVRALYGIGIGCIFGFMLASQVVDFLQRPLNQAIEEFRINQAKEKLMQENRGVLPPEAQYWLQEENLAPKRKYVDPGEIIRMLTEEGTDQSTLKQQLKPYSFTLDELLPDKFGEICSLLANRDSDHKENKKHQAIWEALTDQQRQTVRQIADSGQDSDGQLLVVLNALIDQTELYESAAYSDLLSEADDGFWSWFSPTEKNPLAAMKQDIDDDPDPDQQRRLNKLLVQYTFPDAMRSPRLRLQPIVIWESVEVRSQSLTPTEVFMIWIKAGLITGFFIASPWVFYQIWQFVASGLYRHERNYIYIYLPFSLILFVSGAGLAFFFVFEHVLRFLFQFNATMGIDPQPRIGYWLSFVMFLPLGFGLAFQLPLVMLFLNRVGIFSVKVYLEKWRVAVFVIFLLSMLLTPADPISMITLAIPLTFLYFGGVLMCYLMPKSRNPFKESYEPA